MADQDRLVRRVGQGLVAVGLVAGLSGCTAIFTGGPMSTVDPKSTDFGPAIQDLYALVWWLSLFVFIVVEGALIYAMFRFRRKVGQGLPEQSHGNTRMEIAWTIAPALVLILVAVPSVRTTFATQAQPPNFDQALKVRAIGHQWWFEFEYKDLGLVTANELHVKKGQTVYFDLESADVIHSFWFPAMGGKRDMVPNRTNHLWFTPAVSGRFLGQCVEFCGASHANMRMVLYVHEPAEFDAWVAAQKEPAMAPAAGSVAANGAQLFASKGCVACHTINGVPAAAGKIGPNLSRYGNRSTVAAGMADNTPENVSAWLRNPQAFKAGSLMPNLRLNEDEIAALAEYLLSLK